MAKGAYIGALTEVITGPQLGDVAVGSIVKLNESGSPVEYIVVHQGVPSSMYDASCDGVWLLRKDIKDLRPWHSIERNDYQVSDIHSWLNNDFLALLDDKAKAHVKTVKIPYVNGYGNGGAIASGANGLSTQVFLLSGYEVGWTSSQNTNQPVDGACLSYFAGTAEIDAKRIATYNGVAETWYLRSPSKKNTLYALRVYANGDWGDRSANVGAGIRPALIMPSYLAVGSDGFITGDLAQTELKSLARKIKKGYLGIDGLARKIKKAYIGIGGVARPCWSGGELAYYGTIDGIGTGRRWLGATTIGDYALFGGGSGSNAYALVTAYDKSLVKSSPSGFAYGRYEYGTATVGDYALFAGGVNGVSVYTVVETYDKSLTRSVTSSNMGTSRRGLCGISFNNYALFGGGYDHTRESYYNIVNAYDTSLTRTNPSGIRGSLRAIAGATVNGHALYAGGASSSSVSAQVTVYDSSLSMSAGTDLSVARRSMGGTSLDDYALFGGGVNKSGGGTNQSAIDVYDSSLTRTTPVTLSSAVDGPMATRLGDYALFGGGGYRATVDAFDQSLTRTNPADMHMRRAEGAATTLGDYALFGGGGTNTSSEYAVPVDVYTIA